MPPGFGLGVLFLALKGISEWEKPGGQHISHHSSTPIISLLKVKNDQYNPPSSPMCYRRIVLPQVRAKEGIPGANLEGIQAL